MNHNILIAALILAGLTSVAAAQMNNPPGVGNGEMGSGGGERTHRPTPEAIAVCNKKASGAACSFVGRENKTLTGTCFAPPEGNQPLACRPDSNGQGKGGPGAGGNSRQESQGGQGGQEINY